MLSTYHNDVQTFADQKYKSYDLRETVRKAAQTGIKLIHGIDVHTMFELFLDRFSMII